MDKLKCMCSSVYYAESGWSDLLSKAIAVFVKTHKENGTLKWYHIMLSRNRGDNVKLVCFVANEKARWFAEQQHVYFNQFLADYPSLDKEYTPSVEHLFLDYPNNTIQYGNFLAETVFRDRRLMHEMIMFSDGVSTWLTAIATVSPDTLNVAMDGLVFHMYLIMYDEIEKHITQNNSLTPVLERMYLNRMKRAYAGRFEEMATAHQQAYAEDRGKIGDMIMQVNIGPLAAQLRNACNAMLWSDSCMGLLTDSQSLYECCDKLFGLLNLIAGTNDHLYYYFLISRCAEWKVKERVL